MAGDCTAHFGRMVCVKIWETLEEVEMSDRAKGYLLALEVSVCIWAAVGCAVWAVAN